LRCFKQEQFPAFNVYRQTTNRSPPDEGSEPFHFDWFSHMWLKFDLAASIRPKQDFNASKYHQKIKKTTLSNK